METETNAVPEFRQSTNVPTNGQVPVYNSTTDEWVPTTLSLGGGTGWTKHSFTDAEYKTGHLGDANVTLSIPVAANTVVENILLAYPVAFAVSGGDGITIALAPTHPQGGDIMTTKYIDGEIQFSGESKQPQIEGVLLVWHEAWTIDILLNPSADAPHTMSQITAGELDVYVKTSALP